MSKLHPGTFAISLDLELYWGMLDVVSLDDYRRNLQGVRQAIPAILDLFERYEIHATWATVGFLFHSDLKQLRENLPQQQPNYGTVESPYQYISNLDPEADRELHFCPDLIELIQRFPGQEVATHTFSHYYCLEPGQTKSEFQADLMAAIATARQNNTAIESLVFPRNQYNQAYLETIAQCGISCYRGNERSSFYNSEAGDGSLPRKRLLRLIDSYLNLSGQNCYSWSELRSTYPINIPSSRFLRPYSTKLKYLDSLRLKRITSGLKYAASHNSVYHLWWHPHNFGVNLAENLRFLEKILQAYRQLNVQNEMQSLNMREIAELCAGSSKPTALV